MHQFETNNNHHIYKIKNFFSFYYKNLTSKHPLLLTHTLVLLFLYIPIFLLTFQNCSFDDTLSKSSLTKNSESSKTNTNDTNEGQDGSSKSDYSYGYIIPLDLVNGDIIDGQIPINQKINLKFEKAHPKSDNYKWSIQRGFDFLKTNDVTKTNIYQYTFSEAGAYDVFSDSYEQESHKTKASRRLIVGEDCSLNDVVEIEVLPGYLTGNEPFTQFRLRDSENFSTINWKFTLPTSKEVKEETGTDISLDLSSESGTLDIEVVTSHKQRSQCLIYRKANVPLHSIYFNPPIITDGTNPVPWTLEWLLDDKYIYKYQYLTQPILKIDVNIKSIEDLEKKLSAMVD